MSQDQKTLKSDKKDTKVSIKKDSSENIEEIKDNLNNIKILSNEEISEKVKKQMQSSNVQTVQSIFPQKKQNTALETGRRAEIKLYEADYENVDGYYNKEPEWKPINMGKDSGKPIIVSFRTPEDIKALQMQYAQCDQKFEIIRWLDPIPENNSTPIPEKNNRSIKQPDNSNNEQQDEIIPLKKSKPKYYKIGNIEIKEDNGKIFQKQWIKLSDVEAQNYRIINDKNNSIFNLNGRSIEMKRWVLIENDNENEDQI